VAVLGHDLDGHVGQQAEHVNVQSIPLSLSSLVPDTHWLVEPEAAPAVAQVSEQPEQPTGCHLCTKGTMVDSRAAY
jgi:hypothetical protein